MSCDSITKVVSDVFKNITQARQKKIIESIKQVINDYKGEPKILRFTGVKSVVDNFNDNNFALTVFGILEELKNLNIVDNHKVCDVCLVYYDYNKNPNHEHYYQHDELLD